MRYSFAPVYLDSAFEIFSKSNMRRNFDKIAIIYLLAILLLDHKATADSLIAGCGYQQQDSNDGSAATSACLSSPTHIVSDALGNIYITTGDSGNVKVRRVSYNGIISTYAGGDATKYATTEYTNPTEARFSEILGLAVDLSNNLYISAKNYVPYSYNASTTTSYTNCVVKKVDTSTVMSTYAGSAGDYVNSCSYFDTFLNYNQGIAFDSSNNLYITELNRIRMVSPTTGSITVYAGTGYSGTFDAGAVLTFVNIDPNAITIDSANNVFFSDGTSAIRKIDGSTGVISSLIEVSGKVLETKGGILTNDGSNLYVSTNSNTIVKVTYEGSYEVIVGTFGTNNVFYDFVRSGLLYISNGNLNIYGASTGTSSGFSLSSYYNSNKQEVLALGASAFTMLAHFGLVSYLAASGVQSVKSTDSSADI